MYNCHMASRDGPALWEQSSLNTQGTSVPCRRTGKGLGTSSVRPWISQVPVHLSPQTTPPASPPLSHASAADIFVRTSLWIQVSQYSNTTRLISFCLRTLDDRTPKPSRTYHWWNSAILVLTITVYSGTPSPGPKMSSDHRSHSHDVPS